MSGLAGIFKFDPRDRVSREDLLALAQGIDRIGADGGRESLVGNVGMAYRALHTTPESWREAQPLLCGSLILCWDGRLDNREEICKRVRYSNECRLTDAELVLAAYGKWGNGCFGELIGDWALALWDQARQRLILARDWIGVRGLFYRVDRDGVAWCTIADPLVRTAPDRLHLDLDFLAGCLYPRPPIEATPYQEIRSVVPAGVLTFQLGGKHSSCRSWTLNPHDRIRYAMDAEYEAHFREVFHRSVSRRLRADRTVLAELSGGIDSSSIVCMADEIRRDNSGPEIETLSYYDSDEPSGDERPFFALVEKGRARVGQHISISDFNRQADQDAFAPLPKYCFSAFPGRFANALRWDSMIERTQTRCGARVILSGLGGDELLGGVPYEAPELGDHLSRGDLFAFLRSILDWSLDRRRSVFGLLGETAQLFLASYNPNLILRAAPHYLPWAHLKPLQRHSALRGFTCWHALSPAQVSIEWARYSLGSQLTFAEPPLVGSAERRFPYLDRDLFQFLASIPRTQVLQAGHRRHLMRRSLRGIVPDAILFRKTKWFGSRRILANLRDQNHAIEALFEHGWVSDGLIVNASRVQEQLMAAQHGAKVAGMALISAIGIELWMRSLVRSGTIAWTHSSDRGDSYSHGVGVHA